MAGYDAVLIISSSEIDANMFYASRFLAPDPFVYLEVKKKKILMMSDLEIERAKLQSTVDEVLPSASYNKAAKKKGIEQPGLVDEVHELLSELAVKSLLLRRLFESKGVSDRVETGAVFRREARQNRRGNRSDIKGLKAYGRGLCHGRRGDKKGKNKG